MLVALLQDLRPWGGHSPLDTGAVEDEQSGNVSAA